MTQHKNILQLLQHAINVAVLEDSLHWLVYNATAMVWNLSERLCMANHASQALPYIIHSALAMESNVPLRHPRFIPWRCELVYLACAAYHDLGQLHTAQSFIKHMTDELTSVRSILALDPVPLSKELVQILSDADQVLIELSLTFQLRNCPASDVAKLLTDSGLSTEARHISTLLGALSKRTRPGVNADAHSHPGVFEELKRRISAVVQPVLDAAEPEAPTTADSQGMPHVHYYIGNQCVHYALYCGQGIRPCHVRNCADQNEEEMARRSTTNEAAQSALPIQQHILALVCAFQYQDSTLLETLKQFADIRASDGTSEVRLQQTSALLVAAHAVKAAAKNEVPLDGRGLTCMLSALAAQLLEGRCLAVDLADVYTDCALLLWEVAQPLLDGVVDEKDREAETVVQLLRSLNVAFEALDLEDCVLR